MSKEIGEMMSLSAMVSVGFAVTLAVAVFAKRPQPEQA